MLFLVFFYDKNFETNHVPLGFYFTLISWISCVEVYEMMGTLLEILSYATTPFATGMQLPVACNYFCNYAPFLGVYATMVQL
jgi:hypothetical protein